MLEITTKKETKRADEFASRTVTEICYEEPSMNNSYLAESYRFHGYDLLELIKKRSFIDVFFLLFFGELPSKDQAILLESLMIAFIHPGPRHPAIRASMNTGVGKSNTAHILPVALNVLSGSYLGGAEVVSTMRFFKKFLGEDPRKIATDLLKDKNPPEQGDWHIIPGFGSRFGGIDPLPQKIATYLINLPGAGNALKWSISFSNEIKSHGMGLLSTGVCAAVFNDLGFAPREGAGIFQFICSPGLLAHGFEMADKPLTAMPFIDDQHYIIDESAKKKA